MKWFNAVFWKDEREYIYIFPFPTFLHPPPPYELLNDFEYLEMECFKLWVLPNTIIKVVQTVSLVGMHVVR